MIPVELVLRNFLAYRDPGPLNLDGMHIACLAGPNGAGKSSLLDAITWCLWGKARSSSADDLIHQGQDEMSVSLTFDQGGHRFRALRQRKGGKRGASILEFQAWDDDSSGWRSLSGATIRDTQSRIEELLRLDYETFVNSAFLVQGRADEFTMKTPGQRKQILSNILGLARWEVYESAAKERILESRTGIERLTGRLEEIERELDREQEVKVELATAEQQANRLAAELAETEREWSGLEKTREQLISLQRQIDDLTRRIEARRREMLEVEKERQTALEQADAAAIEAALEQVRAALGALEEANKAWEDAQSQRTTLAEEAAQLKGVNQALGPESEPIKRRVETLESASDPTCPTCGQPLTDEHRHRLVAELTAEIETRRNRYRENLERVREIDGRVGDLDRRLTALRQQIATRPGLEKRVGELEAALKHAGEVSALVENLSQRLTRWEEEVSDDEAKRAGLEEQIAKTELELKRAALTEDAVGRIRLESRLADERVGGARQRIAALEAFKGQAQQLSTERQQATETLGIYEELRDAFGKRGGLGGCGNRPSLLGTAGGRSAPGLMTLVAPSSKSVGGATLAPTIRVGGSLGPDAAYASLNSGISAMRAQVSSPTRCTSASIGIRPASMPRTTRSVFTGPTMGVLPRRILQYVMAHPCARCGLRSKPSREATESDADAAT